MPTARGMRASTHHVDCCLGPDEGVTRSALLAKKDKPFQSTGIRAGIQKSPFRRCFKPRPPWRAGCAGFASGCRSHEQGSRCFLRRLSGLLSGCPPIDTRPQARAKLGKQQNNRFRSQSQAFYRAATRDVPAHARYRYVNASAWSLAARLASRRRSAEPLEGAAMMPRSVLSNSHDAGERRQIPRRLSHLSFLST